MKRTAIALILVGIAIAAIVGSVQGSGGLVNYDGIRVGDGTPETANIKFTSAANEIKMLDGDDTIHMGADDDILDFSAGDDFVQFYTGDGAIKWGHDYYDNGDDYIQWYDDAGGGYNANTMEMSSDEVIIQATNGDVIIQLGN